MSALPAFLEKNNIIWEKLVWSFYLEAGRSEGAALSFHILFRCLVGIGMDAGMITVVCILCVCGKKYVTKFIALLIFKCIVQ